MSPSVAVTSSMLPALVVIVLLMLLPAMTLVMLPALSEIAPVISPAAETETLPEVELMAPETVPFGLAGTVRLFQIKLVPAAAVMPVWTVIGPARFPAALTTTLPAVEVTGGRVGEIATDAQIDGTRH